jgi:serine/threonine protein kinase
LGYRQKKTVFGFLFCVFSFSFSLSMTDQVKELEKQRKQWFHGKLSSRYRIVKKMDNIKMPPVGAVHSAEEDRQRALMLARIDLPVHDAANDVIVACGCKAEDQSSSTPTSSEATLLKSSRPCILNGENYYSLKISKRGRVNWQKLRTEVGILQRLRHKNLVQLEDVVVTRKHVVLVTELFGHATLIDGLAQVSSSVFREDVIAFMFFQILDALVYCHRQGVPHRDLRPSKIGFECVDPSNPSDIDVRLLDFGWARFIAPDKLGTTARGNVVYAAPEVLMLTLQPNDFGCDLWSLGVMLYELMAGSPPWTESDMRTVVEHGPGRFLDFDEPLWSNISEQAKSFICALLVHDPAQRLSAKDAREHAWIAMFNRGQSWSYDANAPVLAEAHETIRLRTPRRRPIYKRMRIASTSAAGGGGGGGDADVLSSEGCLPSPASASSRVSANMMSVAVAANASTSSSGDVFRRTRSASVGSDGDAALVTKQHTLEQQRQESVDEWERIFQMPAAEAHIGQGSTVRLVVGSSTRKVPKMLPPSGSREQTLEDAAADSPTLNHRRLTFKDEQDDKEKEAIGEKNESKENERECRPAVASESSESVAAAAAQLDWSSSGRIKLNKKKATPELGSLSVFMPPPPETTVNNSSGGGGGGDDDNNDDEKLKRRKSKRRRSRRYKSNTAEKKKSRNQNDGNEVPISSSKSLSQIALVVVPSIDLKSINVVGAANGIGDGSGSDSERQESPPSYRRGQERSALDELINRGSLSDDEGDGGALFEMNEIQRAIAELRSVELDDDDGDDDDDDFDDFDDLDTLDADGNCIRYEAHVWFAPLQKEICRHCFMSRQNHL